MMAINVELVDVRWALADLGMLADVAIIYFVSGNLFLYLNERRFTNGRAIDTLKTYSASVGMFVTEFRSIA